MTRDIPAPVGINTVNGLISINPPNRPALDVVLIWLRDNCPCVSCYEPRAQQRMVDTSELGREQTTLESAQIKGEEEEMLEVRWADGHESRYSLDMIYTNLLQDQGPDKSLFAKSTTLWNAAKIQLEFPATPYVEVMTTDQGLASLLLHVDKYGIAFIPDTPPTPEATQKLAERISFIRETHYGTFWDLHANWQKNDTAYSTVPLGAHTDTTYFTDPIGLQLFHILEHTGGTGGESMYLDAFDVARQLREEDPQAYETLSTTPLNAHSRGNTDTNYEPYLPMPILNHHPVTGQLVQVRYNNNDRSPCMKWLSPTAIQEFYRALQKWQRLLVDPHNEFVIANKPGQPVLVDNFRVLHGRRGFTGYRRLCGSYHGHDEYRSKLAVLNPR